LIVYASHSDFEQTNILPFIPPEGLLGVTEFLKRPRSSLARSFRAQATPNSLAYDPSRARARLQLSSLRKRSGATRVSGRPGCRCGGPKARRVLLRGEDSRDRDGAARHDDRGAPASLPDLTYAYGGLVYPVGGSIHRFLAEHYGEWRILELYNDIYKYSSFGGALAGVYGRTIDQLSDEWQYWMRQHYYPPSPANHRSRSRRASSPSSRSADGVSAPR